MDKQAVILFISVTVYHFSPSKLDYIFKSFVSITTLYTATFSFQDIQSFLLSLFVIYCMLSFFFKLRSQVNVKKRTCKKIKCAYHVSFRANFYFLINDNKTNWSCFGDQCIFSNLKYIIDYLSYHQNYNFKVYATENVIHIQGQRFWKFSKLKYIRVIRLSLGLCKYALKTMNSKDVINYMKMYAIELFYHTCRRILCLIFL